MRRDRGLFGLLAAVFMLAAWPPAAMAAPASPLLSAGQPVTWWFAYKFNAKTAQTAANDAARLCPFGGEKKDYGLPYGQTYAIASSADSTLKPGVGLIGTSDRDPLGATFGEIYSGPYSYVVWNDQFKGDPTLPCGEDCGQPWAHAKGLVAWRDDGSGILLQVTTPGWPGAAGKDNPRTVDGNTLGCTLGDNIEFGQHFFALKLTPADVAIVLKAAANAGVATKPGVGQVVHLRPQGPADLATLVAALGDPTPAAAAVRLDDLSSHVKVISKPSVLHVPPWQLVSATLGSEPLLVASWVVGKDGFPSTRSGKTPGCWSPGLAKPGEVQVAVKGTWKGAPIGLLGGNPQLPDSNHAKVAVSLAGGHGYAIFGDMNQTGGLASECTRSQNPRGGLFFVVADSGLWSSLKALLTGTIAAYDTKTVREGAPPAPAVKHVRHVTH
jgi:hypothetical protein